ncbi:putative mitochondrial protein [Sesamum angolense]|uniref:Mitochondrial protein n=1 Tax=Sesamum angolense TaxID=2727404 RepID=A0AAE1X748_9LAMI|nr:putative mitochondrial protein [Sesamum angolense]
MPNVQVVETNVEEIISMVSNLHIGMVTELNMSAVVKSFDWWYDTRAIIHVCNDKDQFKHYEYVAEAQQVLMRNANTTVLGKENVEMQFTSGKKLLLTNVLHVPEIRKNLVSATILSKKALLTACHVHNRILSKKFKISPYELWNDRKPNLNYLKVWGCLAFYRVSDPKRTKLGPRAIKIVFVGFAGKSKTYRLLDLVSNIITESRDVEFFENKFTEDSVVIQPIQALVTDPETNNKRALIDAPIELRRSRRPRKAKKLDLDFLYFIVEGDNNIVLNKKSVLLTVEGDPKIFTEVMTSRDVAFWKEAVNDEMDSLLASNTWVLIELPLDSKAIGCKWVFRRKYNTDGSIETLRARLVAKGFRQKDYLGLQIILLLNIGKALEESLDISNELRIWDSSIIDFQQY